MKHFLVNSPDFFCVKNTKELQAESFIITNTFNSRKKYQLNQLNKIHCGASLLTNTVRHAVKGTLGSQFPMRFIQKRKGFAVS